MAAGREAPARGILRVHAGFFMAVYGCRKTRARSSAQGRDPAGIGRGRACAATMDTGGLPPRVPEQAASWAASHGDADGFVHHADHGVRYISTVCTTRVMEYGMLPSTGTVGDSYDNAMAESVDGAYKTELVWAAQALPGFEGPRIGDVPVGLVAGTRSVCTGPWATGHRNRPEPSTMQTKRRKPPHYKSGTKSGHIIMIKVREKI